jgi:hypothetical protein
MKWTKLALTTTTLATFGSLCFTACDPPEPETEPELKLLERGLLLTVFQLDGNIADDAAGDDWATLFAGGGGASAYTGVLADPGKLTTFTGGGSKDTLEITEWEHANASVPDKTNITNAYAALYETASSKSVVFGADRFALSGDTFLGFWFLQNPITAEPHGTFSGTHAIHDLLILVNFEQGGADPHIQVLEWNPPEADQNGGTLKLLQNSGSALCNNDENDLQDACAITNSVSISSPWFYDPKVGPNNVLEPTAFFEGGVNLTAVFGSNVPCFATFLAETRASTSVTATLKDFVTGQFQTCEPDVNLTANCVGVDLRLGECVGFTVSFDGEVCNPAGDQVLPLRDVFVMDDQGTPDDETDDTEVAHFDDLAVGACEPFSGSYETTAPDGNQTDPALAQFSRRLIVKATSDGGDIEREASFTCPLCPE